MSYLVTDTGRLSETVGQKMGKIILLFLFFGISSSCHGNTIIRRGVTSNDQTTITTFHNDLRSCIALGPQSESCKRMGFTRHTQPPGANIRELEWDDYLANQAQRLADTCTYEHEAIKDSRFKIGQNIAQRTGYGASNGCDPDWKGIIINYWFGEQTFYEFGPFTKDENAGHYTQIVWANTYRVGCGYSCYKTPYGSIQKLYVCNYGPAGNVLMTEPYIIGDPNCRANGYKEAGTPGLCQ